MWNWKEKGSQAAAPTRPTTDPSDQGGPGSPLSFQFYIEILTYGHVDGHAKRSKVKIKTLEPWENKDLS